MDRGDSHFRPQPPSGRRVQDSRCDAPNFLPCPPPLCLCLALSSWSRVHGVFSWSRVQGVFSLPGVHGVFLWSRVHSVFSSHSSESPMFVTSPHAHQGQGLTSKNLLPSLWQLARIMVESFSHQIFVSGFVHADPHPGNILVRRKPGTAVTQLVLLDHGCYLR